MRLFLFSIFAFMASTTENNMKVVLEADSKKLEMSVKAAQKAIKDFNSTVSKGATTLARYQKALNKVSSTTSVVSKKTNGLATRLSTMQKKVESTKASASQLNTALNKTAKASAAASSGLRGVKEQGTKAQAPLKKSNSSMKGMIATLGKLAPLIGVTFAVDTVYRFGKEVINLGSKMDGIENAFKRIADTGKTSLEDLRKATKGTVSDFQIMSLAVQANNFKVPLESLAGLFEFATIRAAETGESADYLVRSIVTGIGRKSPLILDNLGITLVRLKEAMGKVGRESATVNDIAMATVKIAKEETEAIKNLGLTYLTSAQKLERFSANIENFKTSLGRGVTGGGIFDGFMDFLNDEQSLYRMKRIASELAEPLGKSGRDVSSMFVELKGQGMTDLEAYADVIESLQKSNDAMFSGAKAQAAFQYFNPDDFDNIKDLTKAYDKAQKYYSEGGFLGDPTGILGRAIKANFEEGEAALNKIEVEAEKHAEKIKAIDDKLKADLRRNAEQFRQDGDVVKKLQADSQAYSKALHELNNEGESGSKVFGQYDEILKSLKNTLEDKQTTLALDEFTKKLQEQALITDNATNKLLEYKRALHALKDNGAIDDARSRIDLGDEELKFILGEEEYNRLQQENGSWEGEQDEEFEELNESADKHLKKLQSMASMWGIISQAIGGIADGLNGDSGFSKVIGTFAKLAQTAAATAAAVVAVQTALGKTDAGPKAIAAAVGVATALGGVLSAVGGISTGRASGGNLNDLSQATLHTEISGRNLRIVLDRENSFSSRRG